MKYTLDDVNVYPIQGTNSWAWRMKNNFMGGSAYPSKSLAEAAAQKSLDDVLNKRRA